MSKWWTGVLWLCRHQPHFASVSVSLFVYLVSSSDCCSTCIVSCQRLALKRLVKWEEIFWPHLCFWCNGRQTFAAILWHHQMYPVAAEVAPKSHTRSCLLLSVCLLPPFTYWPNRPPHFLFSSSSSSSSTVLSTYHDYQWNDFDVVFSASFLKSPRNGQQQVFLALSLYYGSYLPDLTNVQKLHMPILQIVNTHYVMEHAIVSIYLVRHLSLHVRNLSGQSPN
jgi:hypothetical protein